MDPRERARKISESQKKRKKEVLEKQIEQGKENAKNRWKKPGARKDQGAKMTEAHRINRRKKAILEAFPDADIKALDVYDDGTFFVENDKDIGTKRYHQYIVVNDKERQRIGLENLNEDLLGDIDANLLIQFSDTLREEDYEIVVEMQEYFEDRFADIIINIVNVQEIFEELSNKGRWDVLLQTAGYPNADYKENIKVGKDILHVYMRY